MSAKKSYRVAIVGATGLVGREIVAVLQERDLPIGELRLLASPSGAGRTLMWKGRSLDVRPTVPDAFDGIDIVLMSAGQEVSRRVAPQATARGAVVIDNSSAWRHDPDVPLVVPEVNAAALANYSRKRIVANPNCSTIQMVIALAPLHAEVPLLRLVVCTLQAVSGAGQGGLDELGAQVSQLFNQVEVTPRVFSERIAFNCLPQIGDVAPDGFTTEEHKLEHESRRILSAPGLRVCATCVRVPVFNGHSVAIHAELSGPLPATRARALLRGAPGVMLHDAPTPRLTEGGDATWVGRIRDDPTVPHGLALWCVADNVRRGAAVNQVQIAEKLMRDHLDGE